MRHIKYCLLSSLLLFPSTIMASKQFDLYFLAGQSNMEGFGYIRDLPDELRKTTSRMMIFHGNSSLDNQSDGGLGMWSELQPGHGTGFKSNGFKNIYSLRFGPELSFAHSLLKTTDRRVAIIKFATGGTGLSEGVGYANWAPDFNLGNGNNQYDYALSTIRTALSDQDIDNDGNNDTLIPKGIIWMQGEADAHHSKEAAEAYQAQLSRLIDLLRAALHTDDLPVVIGQSSKPESGAEEDIMPFISIVQQAQDKYARGDSCATIIKDFAPYERTDGGWHFTSEGYLKMGERFAHEVLKLQKACEVK